MGKSFNNDIKISDDEQTTENKIKTGITDRNRIRKDDKGNPDNCEVIYDYWKIFGSSDEVNEICEGCKNASIGCMECKKRLAQKVNKALGAMREKRRKFESKIEIVDDILYTGTAAAQIKAQEVLEGALDVIKMFK